MTHSDDVDGVKKVGELIKEIRTAMLITTDPTGGPRSRPMATQDAEFDGTVWFLTDIDSSKVREIAHSPTVAVSYASSGRESYVSLTGYAEILNDRERIREFWNPFMKAWWEGPEDPRIRVLRVDVQQAEYWDTPGGKVASLIALAKSAITGKDSSMHSDNRTVEFS